MQSIFRSMRDSGDALDLSRGSYDERLSFLSFDDNGYFEATVDRLVTKDLTTILTSALQGSGFVANFENMLAMMESAEFGVRVPADKSRTQPTHFLPSLRMSHPKVENAGLLLQSFYGIISRFERLLTEDSKTSDTKAQAERKIAALEKAFQEILRQREVEVARGFGGGEAVFSLSQLRQATVRRVDFERKSITLTAGGVIEEIPMKYCNHIPREGGVCFLSSDQPPEVYVPRKEVQIFCRRSLGEVLYVTDDWLKLRDGFRNEHICHELQPGLLPGDNVLCLHAGGHFLGIEVLGSYLPDIMVQARENMARARVRPE